MYIQTIIRFTRHIDSFLLACILFTLFFSLAVLYSASGHSIGRVYSQLINITIALTAMFVIANISPNRLETISFPLYLGGVVLLLGVFLFGDISHGARRWLNIGIMKIQPSEIMKLGVPMALAWFFSRQQNTLNNWDFFRGSLLLAVPVCLILKQPDLGTSLLIVASGFYVIFLAGLSWKIIAGGAALAGASLPVIWSMMHDYQRRRVEILLDPFQDPLGDGYHAIQASIALGSGGMNGKGWLNGTQTQLEYLPERTTDFIFAVIGEEFGFVGCLVLLFIFSLIIGRGLYISYRASNTYSRLLAGSITLTFFTYAFVNVGMVSGILPIVGVPLPLISYGGTSLVTLLVGFGILMSIHSNKMLVST
ncbi:rod shape-determining protein RodA [Methylophilus sp.]|uniref:rod shape-determining protein RodA n=1 Tax=Methylophilus sp. TaxID=29541 RepID=UPI0040366018